MVVEYPCEYCECRMPNVQEIFLSIEVVVTKKSDFEVMGWMKKSVLRCYSNGDQ
jgi:hypothetical protein